MIMQIRCLITICLCFIVKPFPTESYKREISENVTEVDFSCMTGDTKSNCAEGTGNARFLDSTAPPKNIIEGSCDSASVFAENNELQYEDDKIVKGSETYACVSLFQWIIKEDTKPARKSTYHEKHMCLFDFKSNFEKLLTKDAKNNCLYYHESGNFLTIHQRLCICYFGDKRNCNTKFDSEFPELPKEAKSLCRKDELVQEIPTTEEITDTDSDTNTKSESTKFQSSWKIRFVLYMAHVLAFETLQF